MDLGSQGVRSSTGLVQSESLSSRVSSSPVGPPSLTTPGALSLNPSLASLVGSTLGVRGVLGSLRSSDLDYSGCSISLIPSPSFTLTGLYVRSDFSATPVCTSSEVVLFLGREVD